MTDFIYQYEASIRLVILFCGFCLLALWQQAKPRREVSKLMHSRCSNSITFLIINITILWILIPAATIGFTYLVNQQQLGLAYHFEMPFYSLIIISFLLLDFSSYIQHTLFHTLPILWRFHRVHHSDTDFGITTGLRFHPVELLLNTLFRLSIIVALGIPVLTIILYEIIRNLMLLFSHSNINLNKTIEPVLRWVFVTPDMHRVHHSILENETNSNFSLNLSVWDRVFNTYKSAPEAGHLNMTIGLNQFRETKCQGFRSLLMLPFSRHIKGYAINQRDNENSEELDYIKQLVNKQTLVFKEAQKTVEKKNQELHTIISHLSESEHYQQSLIENMMDGVITTDNKGFILSFNPAAEKIFGYKASEAIGKNVSMLMPDKEALQHDSHINRYTKELASNVIGINREIEGRRKNGSTFPIDITLSDTKRKNQQIFTAVFRDISTRVTAQLQLRSEKELLENILINTNDAYLTVDNDWVITYVNPVSESLLDIKPEEVIGLDLHEALPDIISMFYKILRATFSTQKEHHATALYGPTMKHLEAHACPFTEGVILSLRDTTERIKSEDKLRQAIEIETRNEEKVIHAAELTSYMKAINEHAIVSITDAAGLILQVNNKFCEVSGYTQDELLGHDHRIINSGTHPKAYFAELWATIASGKKWHGEVCNRAKDGSLYWVDSAVVPLKDQHGNIERYISVRIDITESKHREAEINKAISELAVANKKLEKISRVDGLTQIANRRCFDETLENELARQSRFNTPLTLVLCDIDFFKKYNDSYGHPEGDSCLKQVAQSISSDFSRAGDLVARYGGEEFAIILSNTDKETALTLTERMRENIEQLRIKHKGSSISENVTISIGVTTVIPDKNTTANILIKKADKALYKAKEKGRNNVQHFD
ncbi:MAG: diguanylate cyclase [Gammaproteobacteria bacterium]|nr:diguanylate cyclase [Gammaproteobacteria bacterium]